MGKKNISWIRIAIGIAVGATIGGVLGYYGHCSSGLCPLTSSPYRGMIFGALIGLLLTTRWQK